MIIAITSTIASDTTSLMEGFHHPILSQEGMRFRGRLGLYYWADTSFLGKRAYVEEFVEGRSITDTVFTSELGSMKHPTITNLLYVYDLSDETTIILEHNLTIYM